MVFLNDNKTGKLKLEEAKSLQEKSNGLLKNIQKGNKSEKQRKRQQILICFLMEEMMLSDF